MFDKHLMPNLIALALIAISFTLPAPWQALLLSTGLFALSGALTNWLAVHMLFERVPGLYGSGVITLHFEEFKAGIVRMVNEELFSQDKVDRLLVQPATQEQSNASNPERSKGSVGASAALTDTDSHSAAETPSLTDAIDIEPLLTAIDLDAAYDQLVATIVESSFGSMLAMVGGEAALQPLREPFKLRMNNFLSETARSPRIQAVIGEQLNKAASSERFVNNLNQLLQARLDEMTPDMVRDIMQRMIREHLGWLVVWGGVFGGLIGLAAGLFGLTG